MWANVGKIKHVLPVISNTKSRKDTRMGEKAQDSGDKTGRTENKKQRELNAHEWKHCEILWAS